MQLSIRTQGIHLTEKVKKQTYSKLELALDRLESEIDSIHVVLIDTNGPLVGGIDKACRIEVRFRTDASLQLEDLDENVDTVIDRITDRLGVAASQRADQLRKNRGQRRRWLDHGDYPSFDEHPSENR